jgi:hypothetical protein
MPDAEKVYEIFSILMSGKNGQRIIGFPTYKQEGGSMQQSQNTINLDQICQQTVQAKLNTYMSKEKFESVLATYNEQADNLINLVNLMKNRILELENELQKDKKEMKAQ